MKPAVGSTRHRVLAADRLEVSLASNVVAILEYRREYGPANGERGSGLAVAARRRFCPRSAQAARRARVVGRLSLDGRIVSYAFARVLRRERTDRSETRSTPEQELAR